MKRVIFLCLSLILLASCSIDKKTTEREIRMHANCSLTQNELESFKKERHFHIQDYFSTLTEEEIVSQLFLVNVSGSENFIPVETNADIYRKKSKEEKKVLSESVDFSKPLIPGGYIFFSFNIGKTPENIISFTSSIKKYCSQNSFTMPYLCLDQEGGYVNRLRKITSTLPSNERVSKCLTESLAEELYEMQAQQMNILGFNLNLAPVAEICTEDNRQFLDTRSYGNRSQVIDYSKAAISAYKQYNIGSVLKHFPGNTNSDPHTGLPEISMTLDELEKQVVEPFTLLSYYEPSAILMSHARTSAVDSSTPACLSHYWVQEVVLNQMNFKGLVISDDIFMAALRKNGFPPEDAVVKALEAGVNVLMLSDKYFAEIACILVDKMHDDPDFKKLVYNACFKVLEYKFNEGILSYPEQNDEIQDNAGKAPDSKKLLENFNEIKNAGDEFYRTYFTGK